MIVVWSITAFFVLLIFWGIRIFNRLITSKNDLANAWSQIDVQLKRRYDLIPGLVSAVQGFMAHEKDLLEKVVLARTRAMAAGRIRDRASAEEGLSENLGRLFMVIESYPVIKSNENVMHLQEELVSAENRIAFARQLYNDLAANYRTLLEVFPDTIVASLFSFRPPDFFRADRSEREYPKSPVR